MNKNLKIDHLLTVKTSPADVEFNFSFSNMEFLLHQDELPFTRESIQLHGFSGDVRVGSRHLLNSLSRKEMVPEENIFLSLGTRLNFRLMNPCSRSRLTWGRKSVFSNATRLIFP
jgi:hypothetical protein